MSSKSKPAPSSIKLIKPIISPKLTKPPKPDAPKPKQTVVLANPNKYDKIIPLNEFDEKFLDDIAIVTTAKIISEYLLPENLYNIESVYNGLLSVIREIIRINHISKNYEEFKKNINYSELLKSNLSYTSRSILLSENDEFIKYFFDFSSIGTMSEKKLPGCDRSKEPDEKRSVITLLICNIVLLIKLAIANEFSNTRVKKIQELRAIAASNIAIYIFVLYFACKEKKFKCVYDFLDKKKSIFPSKKDKIYKELNDKFISMWIKEKKQMKRNNYLFERIFGGKYKKEKPKTRVSIDEQIQAGRL